MKGESVGENKIQINEERSQCSGCGACAAVCKENAIEMKKDQSGFYYPQIDENKCVACGMCGNTCPVNRNSIQVPKTERMKVYALKAKDRGKYLQSQSGGAFTLLAEKVLEHQGAVFGVALDVDMVVRYRKVCSKEGLGRLKGSKYVQADLDTHIYKEIKQELQKGTEVLFCGTPCYVAGLLGYLGKSDRTKLITCDLVCHGVPSQEILAQYLDYLERHNGSTVIDLVFKSKENGGKSRIVFSDDSQEVDDTYMNLYYKNICFREKCYCCPYASMERISDITIGDFWGIEHAAPDFYSKKGVSLVMIHGEKGQRLWDEVKAEADYLECPVESCLQPSLLAPIQAPTQREKFWHELRMYGIGFVAKKYASDYMGENFNYEVMNNWMTCADEGRSAADYLVERGIKKVVICDMGEYEFVDMRKNIQMFVTQLRYAGVFLMYVLSMSVLPNQEIRERVKYVYELDEHDITYADAFIIMDEKYFVDQMDILCEKGVPAEKILPFGFLTALEV